MVNLTEKLSACSREYPFEPRFFRHPDSGHRQSYLDEGSGPPVVMVHGNPTWSYYFRDLVKLLSGEHRCLVPDHLGCGLSDKPRDWDYRLQGHIENLGRILDHSGVEQYDLIVHDWGGPIGIGTGLIHPDRIRRIIILNTAVFRSTRIPLRINLCRLPLLGELLVRGLNGFVRPATRMAVCKPMSPEVRRGYLLPYSNWHDRIAISRFVQDIPLKSSHPSYPTLLRIESRLKALEEKPIKLFWGGRDFCFNDAFYKEWLRRFPHAESRCFKDAGHYVLEDGKPEILELIRDFLRD